MRQEKNQNQNYQKLDKNMALSKAKTSYDRGHLIGRQFGGSPDLDNLVRMKESINRVNGEFYRLETSWKDALKLGQSVDVEIKINYPSFGGNVPSSFDVTHYIDGKFQGTEKIIN